MRKGFLIILLAVLIASFQMNVMAGSGKFSVTLGGGIRNISEDIFKTVYGSNNIAYSIDFALKAGKNLELFIHSDYLKSEGELEFDPKETTLTIIPAEAGIRMVLGKSKFKPYIGAGAGYYMLKEENFIGTVDDNSIGFFGEAGLRFYFGKIFIDLKAKYIQLKYDMSGTDVDLGGLSYFGGIGFSF